MKRKVEPPIENVELSEKFDSLMNELPEKLEKTNTQFWKAIIHDTMDIYSLATAAYVFAVILPIIFYEIRRPEPRYVVFKILNYELGEIPMALQVVLISVILTTIVNYFRKILDVGMKWIDNKANGN